MQHIQDDPIITSNEIEVWQDAVRQYKDHRDFGGQMMGRLWTQREDDYIRGHYGYKSTDDIAQKLDRSKQAVIRRAHNIGCAKTADRGNAVLVLCERQRLGTWPAHGRTEAFAPWRAGRHPSGRYIPATAACRG